MKLRARVREIERICQHTFLRQELAIAAITHPSAAEGRPVSASYERLEFLGDSLVGSFVALRAFEAYPHMNEGELSMIKTSLISGKTLSHVCEELGVSPLILLGESERGTAARGMKKALEDVYEALVGALYLDGGYEAAYAFVERTLFPYMTPELAKRPLSPKSRLQEVTQRDLHCDPEYKLVREEGPAHTPTFTTVVLLNGRRVGRGKGPSKKESEAAAALNALTVLGYLDEASAGTTVEQVDEREEHGNTRGEHTDSDNDMHMFVAPVEENSHVS